MARPPHLRRAAVRAALLVTMATAAAGALASCVGAEPAPSRADGGPVVASDASPDAAAGDAADARARACADGRPHDFCDDFEDKSRVDDGWSLAETRGTGELELTGAPDAGGTVMRSALGGSDGGSTTHAARLIREVPFAARMDGTTPKVIVGFDLFIETGEIVGRGAAIVSVKLGETAGGAHDAINVSLDRDESDAATFLVRLIEFHNVDGGVLFPGALTDLTLARGTWTHVELVVGERAPGSAGGMILTVGESSYSYGLASNTRTSTLRVDVGHSVGSVASGTWASYVDNVTIDWR